MLIYEVVNANGNKIRWTFVAFNDILGHTSLNKIFAYS